jgi:hypothetical protein
MGGDAAPWGTLQVALLNEVGLDDVFDSFALFANAGSNVV